MLHHHKPHIKETLSFKMREFDKELKDLENKGCGRWSKYLGDDNDQVGEWVPLEHPYHEGFYFTLQINEPEIRKLPEEVEAHLRSVHHHFINEFVSMEKRPAWKKHWDVIEDVIHFPKSKKDEKERIGHFFSWIPARRNDDGSISPSYSYKKSDKDFFNKELRPYLVIEIIDDINWKGDKVKSYYFTLDKKWRKYFQFRRFERWITHKHVLNGELISRHNYLDKKLWWGDGKRVGLKYILDEGMHHDKDWKVEGQQKKSRMLKRDFESQKRYLD